MLGISQPLLAAPLPTDCRGVSAAGRGKEEAATSMAAPSAQRGALKLAQRYFFVGDAAK